MNPTEPARPLNLGVVWRRAWIVVLCLIVGGGLAYLHARHERKHYSATADLLFGGNSTVLQAVGLANSSANGSQVGVLQATNQNLVGLPVIYERTVAALGAANPPGGFSVSASAAGSSNIVNVQATADTATGAARAANAYAYQFIEWTLVNQKTSVQRAIRSISRRIDRTPRSARLSGQISTLQASLGELETVNVSEPLDVSIAQRAAPPNHPSGPRKTREALLGLLIGLLVGLVFAILLEILDPRLFDVARLGHGEVEVYDIYRGGPDDSGLRRVAVRLLRRMRQPPGGAGGDPLSVADGVFLSAGSSGDTALRRRLLETTAAAACDSALSTAILHFDSGAATDERTEASRLPAPLEGGSDATVLDLDHEAALDVPAMTDVADLARLLETRAQPADRGGTIDTFAPRAGAFSDDAELRRLLAGLRKHYGCVLVDLPTSELSPAADVLVGEANVVVVTTRRRRSSRRAVARQIERVQGLRDGPVLIAVSRRQAWAKVREPRLRPIERVA